MNHQSKFLNARTCDRCGMPMGAHIMSKFDLAIICIPCKGDERQAPGYPAADEAEVSAVRRGELNFPGVGLTDLDREFLEKRLAERRIQAPV